jgi:hypothetical protein
MPQEGSSRTKDISVLEVFLEPRRTYKPAQLVCCVNLSEKGAFLASMFRAFYSAYSKYFRFKGLKEPLKNCSFNFIVKMTFALIRKISKEVRQIQIILTYIYV